MRLLRYALALTLLGVVTVILKDRTRDPERRVMDDVARAGVPGRFVRLRDGVTHYETASPDSGRAVVLAAGFSVPAYFSDSLYQRLADSGFRVLRYDYHGRGWSFGAAILTSFAARHPDPVRSLIYVDPVSNTGRQLRPAGTLAARLGHPHGVPGRDRRERCSPSCPGPPWFRWTRPRTCPDSSVPTPWLKSRPVPEQ
jgi:pimeloyl-ACP methyl ester carboxylesterase